ncbi:MAG: hypothetical protein VW907_00185 [Opitutae bacterium]
MSQGIFKQQNYKDITLGSQLDGGPDAGHLSPATTDGIANQAEAVLSFFHVPSETDIFFKAFITTFNESYSSDWTPDTVFGRTDPIYTFKNTSRNITLGWKIPADTIGEAYENLGKVQKLAQFLYPNYSDLGGNNIHVLTQSPLIRIKLMNLVSSEGSPVPMLGSRTANAVFNKYLSANNPSQGLLGVITSVSINHNLENADAGVIQTAPNTILPKLIEVSIEFKVIHESVLGWSSYEGEGGNHYGYFKDGSFPYNATLEIEESKFPIGGYDAKIADRQAKERGREAAEQARANAEARGYNGLFGQSVKKRDEKRYNKLNEKAAAGTATKRDLANIDYLGSALAGQYFIEEEQKGNIIEYL